MEGDVEALEVAEHPATHLQQHPLPDAPGAVQEEHPADRLQHHHTAQRGHHDDQFTGGTAGHQRRDGVVDAALHQ